MRPTVEARNTLPQGAPALPAGIYIGCTDQATLNTYGDPAHPPLGLNVALPPTPGGGQGGQWVVWQNLLMCAQGSSPFAAVYAQEIIF